MSHRLPTSSELFNHRRTFCRRRSLDQTRAQNSKTVLTLFIQGRINSHGRSHIHQEKTLNRRQVKNHPRLPRHRSRAHITVSTTDQTTTSKTTQPDHVSESKPNLDHNPQPKTIPQAAHL